jgi:hypothetical protein
VADSCGGFSTPLSAIKRAEPAEYSGTASLCLAGLVAGVSRKGEVDCSSGEKVDKAPIRDKDTPQHGNGEKGTYL